jgi:hypothetical protein
MISVKTGTLGTDTQLVDVYKYTGLLCVISCNALHKRHVHILPVPTQIKEGAIEAAKKRGVVLGDPEEAAAAIRIEVGRVPGGGGHSIMSGLLCVSVGPCRALPSIRTQSQLQANSTPYIRPRSLAPACCWCPQDSCLVQRQTLL